MHFPNATLTENTVAPIITRPFFKLDEIKAMRECTMNDMNEALKVPNDVMNSFGIKDQLNPDFWTGDKLNPKVSAKLLALANSFFKDLELPPNVRIKDILFVGSLANYNWSKFSDIDLHIVIDFNDFKDDKDFIKKHFDAEKNLWNDKHEINMFGYPVEIYIQDVKEKLSAAAIYSVKQDKWKLMPDKAKFKLDKSLVKRKVQKLFDKLDNIKESYETYDFKAAIDKCKNLKETIKQMRQSGLEKGGEYSTENIVFKILRRTDFMDILDAFKNKSFDHQMSLKEDLP